MSKIYIDDFFENLYDTEHTYIQKLDAVDTFLVGVSGALVGVGGYYLKCLWSIRYGGLTVVIAVFVVFFLLALCVAILFVVRSVWPRDKGYISSPAEWDSYIRGLEQYYSYYHSGEKLDIKVAEDLSEARRKQYIKAGEMNRTRIVSKHANQARAKQFLIACVVFMAINAFPLTIATEKPDVRESQATANPVATAENANRNFPTAEATTTEDSGRSRRRYQTQEVKGVAMSEENKGNESPGTPQAPSAPAKPPAPDVTKVQAEAPRTGNGKSSAGGTKKE
ncbi:MAG: hypothetical protein AAF596_03630 [Planctomycetota bacterium]